MLWASERCCRYGDRTGRLRGSVRRASGLVLTTLSEEWPRPKSMGAQFPIYRSFRPAEAQGRGGGGIDAGSIIDQSAG